MDYVIGLGANLGSRRATLEAAIALLPAYGAPVVRISRLYDSEPVGPPQPRYYNAAVRVHSELPPRDVLDRLLEIERALGRRRAPDARWQARTVDLDVLWCETAVASAELTVPHPRLRERWFALAPLLEVAPELAREYGAALAALGGERAALAQPLGGERGELHDRPAAAGERAAPSHRDRTLRAAATAADREDALADALGALGRELWPHGRLERVQHVGGDVRAGDSPAVAFVRAALEEAARGFGFSRATVCELGTGRFEGRLLGQRAEPGAVAKAGLRAVHDEPHEGGRRVSIDLAP